MKRRMPSPVRLNGFAGLHETKMLVTVFGEFFYHTSD
jgi:hypothetical protein